MAEIPQEIHIPARTYLPNEIIKNRANDPALPAGINRESLASILQNKQHKTHHAEMDQQLDTT